MFMGILRRAFSLFYIQYRKARVSLFEKFRIVHVGYFFMCVKRCNPHGLLVIYFSIYQTLKSCRLSSCIRRCLFHSTTLSFCKNNYNNFTKTERAEIKTDLYPTKTTTELAVWLGCSESIIKQVKRRKMFAK